MLADEKQAAILIKKKYANSGLTEKLSQDLHSRLKRRDEKRKTLY